MRRHAKASSADSTQGRAGGLSLGATLVVLACLLLALLSAAPAWALDTCPNAVFRTGASAKLPECRAYELVSPPDTGGLPPGSESFFNQQNMFEHETINAAGDSLYFTTIGGPIGDSPGSGKVDYYRVRRTDEGWSTSFEGVPGSLAQAGIWYGAPSPDLEYYAVTLENGVDSYPSGVYLHTPHGFEFLAKGSLGEFPGSRQLTETERITAGGQHIIFWTPHRLEPNAPAEGIKTIYDRSANGPTHVVSLLPGDVTPNTDSGLQGISPDGRDVVFQLTSQPHPNPTFPPGTWYVRHDNSVTREVLRPEGTVVGKRLSCQAWGESGTLAYQWLRNGAPIEGATAATYVVTSADEGAPVQCQLSNSSSETARLTASAPRIVEPYAGKDPAMPPTTELGQAFGVSVGGTPAVGQLLTCSADSAQWKGSPTFTYQWFRNGAEIGGAASNTYTPVVADKGKAVECRVKGSNADGASVSFGGGAVVEAQTPTASANPAITNVTDPGNAPEAGDELSCSEGTWSGSPSFAYQWLSDGAEISGATSSTYTLQAADEGAIQCRVTATNGDGSTQAVSHRAFFGSPVPSGETHPFLETFGSAAQPSFSVPTSLAVDQASGDLLVVDPEADTVSRFKPDGTPDAFSALGSNVISSTSEGPLEFPFAEERRRGSIQITVDNSGGATQGNIYLATGTGGESRIDVFASSGAFLGKIDHYKEGADASGSLTEFAGRACGVAVDSSGNVYVGDSGGFVHKYVPGGAFPTATDNTANFSYPEACTLAAGTGSTAGFIFATSYEAGKLAKLDSSTGEEKYALASGVATVSVDPSDGHVYAIKGSELEELDASGSSSASTVSTTGIGTGNGVAVRGSNTHVFATSVGNDKVSVYGPAVPAFAEPPEQLSAGGVFGSPHVGNSLFCEAGTWSGGPSFNRQWLRNGEEIAGATESSYTLTSEDLEKVIQCRVTATNVAGATVAIDADSSGARYVGPRGPLFGAAAVKGMHPDFGGAYGGHVFYEDAENNRPLSGETVSDLYSYDIATQATTMISPGTEDSTFVHVSEDGSHVYFLSRSVIGGEGEAGKPNLYVWLQSDHSTKFIATLEDRDLDGGRDGTGIATWMASQSAMKDLYTGRAESHTESSADGSVLLFMAHSQLTSFDNTEASEADCGNAAIPDEGCLEIYRYDSNADEITCVSCPPGPGPAHGDAAMQYETESGAFKSPLLDLDTVTRNMTADTNTVFFESEDGLVPGDDNGRVDVYRWNKDNGLALISTGQDLSNSYLDAVTPSGSDVVIATEYGLVPWDENGGTQRLYDARVDGGFPPPERFVTEPCSGDICQGASTAAPRLPGASSASLNGEGNVKTKTCPRGRRRVVRRGGEACVKRRHHHKRHRHRRAGAKRGAAR